VKDLIAECDLSVADFQFVIWVHCF